MNDNMIIETQYFGSIQYFVALAQHHTATIELMENWQKISFRNRTVIAGSNGLITLTIPILNGREQKGLIKDIKINYNQHWQKMHWKTIISCYGKSPFFEFYKDKLYAILVEKQFVYLIDLNQQLLQWALQQLKLKTTIVTSQNFIKEYHSTINDYRNKWVPKNFQNQESLVTYTQVFQHKIGFQHNLSIIDILFCEGPAASQIINSINI